jgi:hypothetical protein
VEAERSFEEMARKPRDYKKEYREYHAKPEQKKRRAERNRDRAAAEKAGKVRKGDGKEVDHINAPRKGSLAKAKTQVISKAANRRKQPKRS